MLNAKQNIKAWPFKWRINYYFVFPNLISYRLFKKHTHTLKDFENVKNENYFFFHLEHLQPSLTGKIGWERHYASSNTYYQRFYRQ